MKIEITVYKKNGKWYATEIVEVDKDIPMYKDEFKQFVKENVPANIREGFISTKDLGNGFHNALWRYEEIFN